ENIGADLRGEFLLRDDHAVFGRNGANGGEVRGRIEAALFLRDGQRPAAKYQRDRDDRSAPSGRKVRHRNSAAVGARVMLGNSASDGDAWYMSLDSTEQNDFA